MPTKIEWCDETWNCAVGCTKIKQSCRYCFAERIHNRWHIAFMRGKNFPMQYAKPFSNVQCISSRLQQPYHWKRKRNIFVNSMSDVFHKDVPFVFTEQLWETMYNCNGIEHPQHNFLILTKRPENAVEFQKHMESKFMLTWYDNIWIGISVSTQKDLDEMMLVFDEIDSKNKFLSVEPMLGEINFENHLHGISWCIFGCESGKQARPMNENWVRKAIAQCKENDIPVFYKQRMEGKKLIKMPLLDGRCYNEFPKELSWKEKL